MHIYNQPGPINQNGLMGGAMVALNTTAVEEVVKVLATISDGTGPGGGPFVFKKCGAGSLELSGKNTFTGQTVLESGTLRVASLNSFTTGKGQPSSSLGPESHGAWIRRRVAALRVRRAYCGIGSVRRTVLFSQMASSVLRS